VAVQQGKTFRSFTMSDAMRLAPWFLSCFAGPPKKTNKHAVQEVVDSEPTCCAVMSLLKMAIGSVVGNQVLLVEERDTTPEVMFYDEIVKMYKRINILRLIGCVLLSTSLYLILNPISVILSFIPFLSGMLSNMFFVVALILGFSLGGVIIACAWILHHPEMLCFLLLLIGGPLVYVGGTSLFLGECLCGLALLPGFLMVSTFAYQLN
jgi:Transmembrane protein 43